MPHAIDPAIRAGFFDTVAQAERAVHNLRAAGFTHDELVVICPDKFKGQFAPDMPHAEHPGDHAKEGIAAGGALGATLGGLALAAVAIGTGGVALLPAATVLIGGGAIAGGFSGLIMADGYGKGVGEYYEQAIRLGKIVVGVHIGGQDRTARLEDAARILAESGAEFLTPALA